MLIDQFAGLWGMPGRLKLAVYGGGGHMPYIDDGSRAAMHEDARKLVTGGAETGGGTPAAAAVR